MSKKEQNITPETVLPVAEYWSAPDERIHFLSEMKDLSFKSSLKKLVSTLANQYLNKAAVEADNWEDVLRAREFGKGVLEVMVEVERLTAEYEETLKAQRTNKPDDNNGWINIPE